jgi:serine protease Do
MRTVFGSFLLVGMLILVGACASILNGKSQKMVINTDHADNQVYVDDSLIGTGQAVNTTFKRDFKAKEIRIEREGQEPKTYAEIQTKKSGLYFFSWIPFGFTFYSVFMDSHPKAFNYNKTLPVYSTSGEKIERSEEQKYIFVNNASINIAAGDFENHGLDYKKYSVGNMEPNKYGSSNTNELSVNSIEIQGQLNEILKNRQFVDTTKTFLKRKTNTLYIDAEITKWVNYNVYRSFVNAGATSFMYGEIDVKWVLRDVYKQVLYETTLTTTTDQFRAITYAFVGTTNNVESPYEKVINDALEKSLVEFLREDNVQNNLPIGKDEVLTDVYEIQSSAIASSKLTEAIKASVTIKMKDESHGSGFFISDNHIVTNYHVVAGTDTVEIITNGGEKLEGIVVRSSPIFDLALIKVDFKNEYCLSLKSARVGELGEEVFAIGTPSSLELTQTLSKGIISGRRVSEEVDLIQTDVSINPGNSGGALVDPKGVLIAVVNSKLVGSEIEGIGFGIPAEKIIEFLKLDIK